MLKAKNCTFPLFVTRLTTPIFFATLKRHVQVQNAPGNSRRENFQYKWWHAGFHRTTPEMARNLPWTENTTSAWNGLAWQRPLQTPIPWHPGEKLKWMTPWVPACPQKITKLSSQSIYLWNGCNIRNCMFCQVNLFQRTERGRCSQMGCKGFLFQKTYMH